MIPLDIFEPTKTRTFTYYDRCAIRLDEDEMTAVRLRISVAIQRTPVSRSLNLKYPYSKEFFGYFQSFHANRLYGEAPINYSNQFVYDYWNQHGTLAHQITSVLEKLSVFFQVSAQFQDFLLDTPITESATDYESIILSMRRLTEGLTYEESSLVNDLNPGNNRVNTFNHPFDLIRLKFPFGTVFGVGIESWQAGNTGLGADLGNPATADEDDQTNPNNENPAPSGGANNPLSPYGANPPPSSPIDPSLDPNDFSNAPPPIGGGGSISLQGWQSPTIRGQQTATVFITCPAGSLPEALPSAANVQQVINLGVRQVPADSQLRVLRSQVLSVFPETQGINTNINPRGGCPYGGLINDV